MKIIITKSKGLLDKILMSISLVLFGLFLTSLSFLIPMNFFQKTGVYLGLLLSAGLIFCGFYYFKKGSKIRLIAWSMLVTILSFIVLFLIGINYLEKSLEGF